MNSPKWIGFIGDRKVRTIQEAAHDDFNINKVSAICTSTNLASQKLILKLGFNFVKTIQLPDDTEELLLYRIILE